jgi:hypothetical protein
MLLSELFEPNYEIIQKIKKSIKKAAMDPNMPVKNAVELVRRAYKANGVEPPALYSDKDYQMYEDICIDAVKQLNNAMLRGVRDDSWKYTPNDVNIT